MRQLSSNILRLSHEKWLGFAVQEDRARNNGFQFQESKFLTKRYEELPNNESHLTVNLHQRIVDSPPLEIFNQRLEGHLSRISCTGRRLKSVTFGVPSSSPIQWCLA